MPRYLTTLCRTIDKTNTFFFKISVFLTLLLVLLVTKEVIARHFFKESSVAMQELSWHFFGTIFMLAAPYTYQKGGHVKVDIFHRTLSNPAKNILERVGIILFLFPTCLILILYGYDYALAARGFASPEADNSLWQFLLQGEASSDPGGLPARWIIRSVFPFGGVLLLFQGVSQFIKTWDKGDM